MTVASDPSLPSSPVSRFFPLIEGHIWAYDAESDDDPTKKGMFVTRVRRLAGARFAFVSGNGEHTLEARADGIVQTESDTYLLKAPLVVGASWPGEHGVVRVTALDKAVEVPAGKFVGCVETAEESASATSENRTVPTPARATHFGHLLPRCGNRHFAHRSMGARSAPR